MDHIETAKTELQRATRFHDGNDLAVAESEWAIKCAQTHALISIAESLAVLAGTVSDRSIDIHEVK